MSHRCPACGCQVLLRRLKATSLGNSSIADALRAAPGSIDELAARTRLSIHTVRSWMSIHRHLVEVQYLPGGSGGHPPRRGIYRVRGTPAVPT